MNIAVSGDKITFSNDDIYAYTDYSNDLWDKISTRKWHVAWNRDKREDIFEVETDCIYINL